MSTSWALAAWIGLASTGFGAGDFSLAAAWDLTDGTGAEARFNFPRGLAADAAVTKANVVYQGLQQGRGPAASPTLTPISSRTDAQNAGFTITTGMQFQP